MAKESNSLTFKNACIDYDNGIITEIGKDYCKDYNLHEIMRKWHGVEGITLSFKKDCEIEPLDDDCEGGEDA